MGDPVVLAQPDFAQVPGYADERAHLQQLAARSELRELQIRTRAIRARWSHSPTVARTLRRLARTLMREVRYELHLRAAAALADYFDRNGFLAEAQRIERGWAVRPRRYAALMLNLAERIRVRSWHACAVRSLVAEQALRHHATLTLEAEVRFAQFLSIACDIEDGQARSSGARSALQFRVWQRVRTRLRSAIDPTWNADEVPPWPGLCDAVPDWLRPIPWRVLCYSPGYVAAQEDFERAMERYDRQASAHRLGGEFFPMAAQILSRRAPGRARRR